MLPDHEIERLCLEADMVAPYDPAQLQSASYDVQLDAHFIVFESSRVDMIDLRDPPVDDGKHITTDRLVLHPGEFVLGATYERVCLPDDVSSKIEGRSSIGRLGLTAHVTAGCQ